MVWLRKSLNLPLPGESLPGRAQALPTAQTHYVFGHPLKPPFPPGIETALFAMGCFWGAERKFWELGEGIYVTAAGYAGTVLVAFDPAKISYERLLKTFWENHDPTQGMRQGNDAGTQYRSAIFAANEAQRAAAEASRTAFAKALRARGFGPVTTEIAGPAEFYYAEAYHQQYLAKNPQGYCGLGGTGVACPAGLTET